MRRTTLRNAGVPLLIFFNIVSTSPAAVAATTGQQTLREPSNAVDTFRLDCPINSNVSGAKAKVWDLNPRLNNPAKLTVFVIQTTTAAQRVDENPAPTGEGGGSSPQADEVDGGGVYTLTFQKTAQGRETYKGEGFCYNTNGTNVGGTLTGPITDG